MRQLITTLYKFEELNDVQKAQACELYKTKNYENLFSYTDGEIMRKYFADVLHEDGKYPTSIEVRYSLSHSQGDGVSFHYDTYFDTDEILTVAERLLNEVLLNFFKKQLLDNNLSLTGFLKQKNNHYVHKYTMDFELICEQDDDLDDETMAKLIDISRTLEAKIIEDLREYADRFENEGYEEIRRHYTNEYISGELEESLNEFELSEDGEVIKIW